MDQTVLPKGRALIDVYLEISLVSGNVFKPFSIAPDLWYGVSDDITVGLVHSVAGETGFIGGTGSALCLSGSDVCKVYNNVGADLRYKLKAGTFSWAVDSGLFFDELSPDVFLDLKLGVLGRWHKDKVSLELQPALFFGLTNRTQDVTVGGVTSTVTVNGDVLSVPVTGLYALTPKIAAALQIGLVLPFEDTSNTYAVPLSIGVHFLATEHFLLNAAFSLNRLIANGGGADDRSLTIGGSYAL